MTEHEIGGVAPQHKALREALMLRREDAALAMNEAKKHPWLCAGLDSAILPSMLEAPPSWIPQAGERMAAKQGSYLVLRRESIQPKTPWPWLLCSLERLGSSIRPAELPISLMPLAHFSRRSFIYCSLLCWKEGRSRQCVDELGNPLLLVAAIDLARAAAAMPSGPKLAGFRSSRSRSSAAEKAPTPLSLLDRESA